MTSLIILILRVYKATSAQRLQILHLLLLWHTGFQLIHAFGSSVSESKKDSARYQGPLTAEGPLRAGPLTAGALQPLRTLVFHDIRGSHDRRGPLTTGGPCALLNLHNR